jgi:hypothetical protein
VDERGEVARASVWQIRPSVESVPAAGQEPPPFDAPVDSPPEPVFDPPWDGESYFTAMERRGARGAVFEPGPAAVWMRARIPLVAGEGTLAADPSLGGGRLRQRGSARLAHRTTIRFKTNDWEEPMQSTMTRGLVRLGDTDLTEADPAEDIRGRTVIDVDGEEIGEVRSLFIDADEHRVRFFEVEGEGLIGVGARGS